MAEYGAIGFVDDDPNRVGRQLCGLPVENTDAWIPEKIAGDLEIWISSPKIPTEKASVLSQRLKRWTRIRRITLELTTIQERLEYRIGEGQSEKDSSSEVKDSRPGGRT